MNKCWFDYKTVVLSGASSGIGKGIAERLIKDHGCKVIGIARNEQRLQNFKAELGNKSDNFTYYTFDVSQEEKWHELADTLKKENIKPDILINNAGILPKFDKFMKRLAKQGITYSEWQKEKYRVTVSNKGGTRNGL